MYGEDMYGEDMYGEGMYGEADGQEEGWMKSEEFNVEAAEYMDETMFDETIYESKKKVVKEEDEEDYSDVPSSEEPEEDNEEGPEPEDDSNWAKPEDKEDFEDKEPEATDIPTNLDKDVDIDDDDDDLEPVSTPSIEGMDFKLLSNGKGDFQIMVKGETIDVPNDEIYTSIAMDKSIKAGDRAEMIYDEMKKYGDI